MEMDWSLVCITKYFIRIEKKTTRNAIFGLEKMLCWFVMAIPQWQIQCNALQFIITDHIIQCRRATKPLVETKIDKSMDTPIENKAPTWIPTMSNNTIFLWCFTDWTALLLLLHQVERVSLLFHLSLAPTSLRRLLLLLNRTIVIVCFGCCFHLGVCFFSSSLCFVEVGFYAVVFVAAFIGMSPCYSFHFHCVPQRHLSLALSVSGFCCKCALRTRARTSEFYFVLFIAIIITSYYCYLFSEFIVN